MSDFELPEKPPVFEDIEETSRAEEEKPERERKSRKKGGAKKPAVAPPASADELHEGPKEEPEEEEPVASQTPEVERPKTPAEALSDYFMKVESGTDFLQRIVSMPEDNELRGSMQLSELERLSGELSQKVIDFFALIETWEQDKKSATEMARSKEEFITSHAVPSGCQTAFRTVALFAINKILGPVTETLKAPRKTKPPSPPPPPPAPATGEATEGAPFSYRPRSVDEVLDELVTGAPAPAHSAPQATETAPAAESPKAVPASEGEAESFLERVRARGARIGNPSRKSAPKAPPPAPPAPPKAESAPAPAAAPQATETAPPEKPKLGAEVPLMITREMEEQLAKRGLKQEDINKLKPEEAWKILNSGEASETAAETGAITSLTREKIEALTFENLADLNDDELQAVVGATTLVSAGSWGKMMQGMSDSLVKRVRRAVNNQDYFDEMLKNPVETAERLRGLREDQVSYTKDALLKAIQLGSPVRMETPEVTPATHLGAPEAPPPTPPSIETAEEQKELTFDDLSKLGEKSQWSLFFSANVNDKPALLAVLSAHSELRRVMLAALPDANRKEIEQDIAALGSKTESEVREAERVIVEMARKQQQDGEISLQPTPESVIASGLTPEKIQLLTWENLFELDDDSLRAVVKASDSSSYSWGSRMRKMPEPLISRVRACIGNQDNFDMGMSAESKNTVEDERRYRDNTVWYAKRELLRILQRENPS